MFRAGEQGRFWYAVLGGSLEVRYHAPDNDSKVSQLSLNIFLFINQGLGGEKVTQTKIKFFLVSNTEIIAEKAFFLQSFNFCI